MGGDVNSLSNNIEEGAIPLFNRLRGKMQRKPLVEFLGSYGLPKGLFPKNETHYEVEEDTRKSSVFIPYVCEVGFKDSSVLTYATKVTRMLSQGKFSNIVGLKTKILVWGKVTSIGADVGPPRSRLLLV
ncbi:hypothetical protein KP509_15G057400 [Ceratopteris richardii]|uniref:Uncharacterized protein n=1 Tax=Ceratopteris richardii TaxID=49495 RepID=A0A8T2T5Y0_CERRI|nr:hypothetical protein KP509_15G057400 [Ceratopteris richardii]